MVMDVESIGLHGEGFAVGWVVVDAGKEIEAKMFWCDPDKASGDLGDRIWVSQNCKPETWGKPNCELPNQVRKQFWRAWKEWKDRDDVVLWADTGWPVETRFLSACIDDARSSRTWEGPYPLNEIATLIGYSNLAEKKVERLPSENPVHNPLADARFSARLLQLADANLCLLKALAAVAGRCTKHDKGNPDNECAACFAASLL